MPVDKMILDAMLGAFRTMAEDCKNQNLSGENFDNMCKVLNRMEQLGKELDDINAYNAQIMQENLFGSFSDYYTKTLTEQAKANSGSGSEGGYDDAALLKQSINGLKQAVKAICDRFEEAVNTAGNYDPMRNRNQAFEMAEKMGFEITEEMKQSDKKQHEEKMKKTPYAFDNSVEVEVLQNPEETIKPIQDIINLGEQEGMTFPKFLRLQIETGLDKAMEGAVVARKGLETEKEFTVVNPVTPFHLQKIEKKIEKFDELSSAHKFNVPNWKELSMSNNDIDREFQPDIIKWNKITDMWEKLISDLSFWSLSYCSFAPNIDPWNMSRNPREAVIRTQKTTPGIFRERLKLTEKYFGISFPEILKHETFKWAVKHNYISYSQEYIEFLAEKILSQCVPFNNLSSDLITKKEKLYKDKKESNPLSHLPAKNLQVFYDNKFGEGRHESKFGPIVKNDSKAALWNIDTEVSHMTIS